MSNDVEVAFPVFLKQIDKTFVELIVNYFLCNDCNYNVTYTGNYRGIKTPLNTDSQTEKQLKSKSKPSINKAIVALGSEGGGSISLGRKHDSLMYPFRLPITQDKGAPAYIVLILRASIAFDNRQISHDMKHLASELALFLKKSKYEVGYVRASFGDGDLFK